MSGEEWDGEDPGTDALDELLGGLEKSIVADDALRAALAPHALKDCVLVSPDGTAVLVIVPDGAPPGVAVVDPHSGDRRPFASLQIAFSEDPRLRLTSDAEVVIGDPDILPEGFGEEDDQVFRFVAESWEGAVHDRSGGSEWRITLNGERLQVDLEAGVVTERPPQVREGEVLRFEWGEGYSGIRVDDRGLAWFKTGPETGPHFLIGPAEKPVSQYVALLAENPDNWARALWISTDLLSRGETATALRFLAGEGVIDLDVWLDTVSEVRVGGECISLARLLGRKSRAGRAGDE
jgi:hypothetical protein